MLSAGPCAQRRAACSTQSRRSNFGSSHFRSSHFCSNLSLPCAGRTELLIYFIQCDDDFGWSPKLDPGRGARAMAPGDPRPKTEVGEVADAVWAQSLSRPEEWSRSSTPRRCNEGARVRHGISRAIGWYYDRRVREQAKVGTTPTRAPVPEVTFEAAVSKCRSWKQLFSLSQIAWTQMSMPPKQFQHAPKLPRHLLLWTSRSFSANSSSTVL